MYRAHCPLRMNSSGIVAQVAEHAIRVGTVRHQCRAISACTRSYYQIRTCQSRHHSRQHCGHHTQYQSFLCIHSCRFLFLIIFSFLARKDTLFPPLLQRNTLFFEVITPLLPATLPYYTAFSFVLYSLRPCTIIVFG